ncbi:MAG: Sugar phosphatase YidA [Firmicutes bacterium ADurb.Bin099]|nr:MAG: Sugar phosphatase YidA [Firmicutes bacterium ADurb.Bin099]
MSDIKLIVVDLDDTLLRKDKSISDYSRKIIADVRKKGILFAFASARGGVDADIIIAENIFDAYIKFNGSRVFANEKCICQYLMQPEILIPFLQELNANGIPVVTEVENVRYANFNPSEKGIKLGSVVITDYSTVQNKPFISGSADKIFALINSDNDIALMQKALPDSFRLQATRDGFAIIMHREATKSNGIKQLAAHYSIALSDVAAFGDDVNDIDMLKTVGRGIAMENAVAEVKQSVSEICLSNENDGVAKWIEQHCL